MRRVGSGGGPGCSAAGGPVGHRLYAPPYVAIPPRRAAVRPTPACRSSGTNDLAGAIASTAGRSSGTNDPAGVGSAPPGAGRYRRTDEQGRQARTPDRSLATNSVDPCPGEQMDRPAVRGGQSAHARQSLAAPRACRRTRAGAAVLRRSGIRGRRATDPAPPAGAGTCRAVDGAAGPAGLARLSVPPSGVPGTGSPGPAPG